MQFRVDSITSAAGRTLDRRNFMQIGGLGSLGLAHLLSARQAAAQEKLAVKDTSVIWLWLAGGPSQIETFDPKMNAPVDFRSVTGEVKTTHPGITFGGTFPQMAQIADKLAIVRSFAHSNSSHVPATNRVMTGYEDPDTLNNTGRARPGLGAIVAKARGASHPQTGMPTYVGLMRLRADGPGFLGPAYQPFDLQTEAAQDVRLEMQVPRLNDRRSLLTELDGFRRESDTARLMEGLDHISGQAFSLILGAAADAFDIKHEDPATIATYGPGLGEQLLLARRLCEAGSGFVTIKVGGWDHHGVNGTDPIYEGMMKLGPPLDHAVTALVQDIHQRGLEKKILLVVTGEFGRSPRISPLAGRDHWAPLSTLALSGGGLRMGQIVGTSSPKAEHPTSEPISPHDLMATVFHVLGIDPKLMLNNNGRPVYAIEDGRAIRELI
jgi:uncharacterized protein (DUF1501 family)